MRPIFQSFFQAGFECSTHRVRRTRRLDLVAATFHDLHAQADYAALRRLGISTVRDGLRWHLIEAQENHYEWASVQNQLSAARDHGMQVLWDLCHYGWPAHLDIWQPAFVEHFARYAGAAASRISEVLGDGQFYCPVNEISFWAWAGGDVGLFNPWGKGRGMELKKQLVRATLAGMEAIRAVDREARFVLVDPAIHVVAASAPRQSAARHACRAQFEAWDMIAGRKARELGGAQDMLDIIGVNYYPNNQWVIRGRTIPRGSPRYRPFRDILSENWKRYGRPLFVAETGTEGEGRVDWLRYVCDEVEAAIQDGVPVEGICLYPVTDYPGWADARHCPCGLLGIPDGAGRRAIYTPLAEELQRQTQRFAALTRHAFLPVHALPHDCQAAAPVQSGMQPGT